MGKPAELPIVGAVVEVPYPFVRDTFITHEADSEGAFSAEIPTWRPGTRTDTRHSPIWTGEDVPDVYSVADGMGAQLLWVISVHRPGTFQTRVFYTRKWRDPDGHQFGKGGLRVLSITGFRSLARGYRHNFEIAKSDLSEGER